MDHRAAWYRDRDARRFIVLRYLPWLAGLSLGWEVLHTPLYTIWAEATPGYLAFAILHCTAGDVLIGGAALVLALLLVRPAGLAKWPWRRIALLSVIFGASYTVYSEWVNITVLRSWGYAESMPTVRLGEFRLGVLPLAQWLLVPPLALYLALRSHRLHLRFMK